MPQEQKIKGLPPGAIVVPLNAPVKGLPEGAKLAPVEESSDPQAELKQKYGLPASADLTKGFMHPANKDVKDAQAFSKAYAELHPPAPPKTGFIGGGYEEAKGLLGSLLSHEGATSVGTPPGAGLVEYAKGIKENPINAIPIVGPMATARYEQAKTDPWGAAGAGLVDLTALAAPSLFDKGIRGKVTGAPSAAREAIGAKLYTPEGKMRPRSLALASLAGGAAGGGIGLAVGHPYAGILMGAPAGAGLLEAAFPEPRAKVIGRAYDAAAIENKKITGARLSAEEAAYEQNNKMKAEKAAAEQAAYKERDTRYTQDAQARMARQAQQDALDRKAAAQAKGAGNGEPVIDYERNRRLNAAALKSGGSSKPVGVPTGPSYVDRGLLNKRPSGVAPVSENRGLLGGVEEGRFGMNKGNMGWEEQKLRSIVNSTYISPEDFAFATSRLGRGWEKLSQTELMGKISGSRPPRVE